MLALFRLIELKVATPFTALAVVVPPSVALPGLVPIANVTDAVDVVTVFPLASWIVTLTAGVTAAPTPTAASHSMF